MKPFKTAKYFKVAAADLINMGISVVSYALKDISDDHVHSKNMAEALLMTRFCRNICLPWKGMLYGSLVKCDAHIGEAEVPEMHG